MILVTVGTQLPFDRLIKNMEIWAKSQPFGPSIKAQIGPSDFTSDYLDIIHSVEPSEFESYLQECELIVSHAGMGSILTALRVNKPIIIFPRRASLKEHRNDHQMATARSFAKTRGVYVTYSKEALYNLLKDRSNLVSGVLNPSDEYQSLIKNIRKLIK